MKILFKESDELLLTAQPDEKICCDAKYFLKALLKFLPKKINLSEKWLSYCSSIRKKYPMKISEADPFEGTAD